MNGCHIDRYITANTNSIKAVSSRVSQLEQGKKSQGELKIRVANTEYLALEAHKATRTNETEIARFGSQVKEMWSKLEYQQAENARLQKNIRDLNGKVSSLEEENAKLREKEGSGSEQARINEDLSRKVELLMSLMSNKPEQDSGSFSDFTPFTTPIDTPTTTPLPSPKPSRSSSVNEKPPRGLPRRQQRETTADQQGTDKPAPINNPVHPASVLTKAPETNCTRQEDNKTNQPKTSATKVLKNQRRPSPKQPSPEEIANYVEQEKQEGHIDFFAILRGIKSEMPAADSKKVKT